MTCTITVGVRVGVRLMVRQTSVRTLNFKRRMSTRLKTVRDEGSKADNFYKRWPG
ncbi:hypothetical protein HAX54_022620, partial [Datura stramonium]|nr:hypothetical protein [Datura stramonium]